MEKVLSRSFTKVKVQKYDHQTTPKIKKELILITLYTAVYPNLIHHNLLVD